MASSIQPGNVSSQSSGLWVDYRRQFEEAIIDLDIPRVRRLVDEVVAASSKEELLSWNRSPLRIVMERLEAISLREHVPSYTKEIMDSLEIADSLLEIHENFGIHLQNFDFALPTITLEYKFSGFDEILSRLNQFVEHVTDVQLSMLTSQEEKQQLLDTCLKYALQNSLPILTQVAIKKGADFYFSQGNRNLTIGRDRLQFPSNAALTQKLKQGQADRDEIIRQCASAQLERSALLFCWKKKQDEASSSPHIGNIPPQIIPLIGRAISLPEINWPVRASEGEGPEDEGVGKG